jgi:hypothetical protein
MKISLGNRLYLLSLRVTSIPLDRWVCLLIGKSR